MYIKHRTLTNTRLFDMVMSFSMGFLMGLSTVSVLGEICTVAVYGIGFTLTIYVYIYTYTSGHLVLWKIKNLAINVALIWVGLKIACPKIFMVDHLPHSNCNFKVSKFSDKPMGQSQIWPNHPNLPNAKPFHRYPTNIPFISFHVPFISAILAK